VDFRLQTPNGFILEPWRAMSEPAMRYVLDNSVSYYRLALPTQLIPDRFDQGGTWHALLTIGQSHLRASSGNEQGVDMGIARGLLASPAQRLRSQRRPTLMSEEHRSFAIVQRGGAGVPSAAGEQRGRELAVDQEVVPYSLIVHSYSSVSLRADIQQDSFELGARVRVRATLTQSSVPLQENGTVWGELIRPDGSQAMLTFAADEAGVYEAEFVAGSSGVHKVRVRGRGRTRRGMLFSREQTLTAVAWRGGDRPPQPNTDERR
jgi:hypothetical protein